MPIAFSEPQPGAKRLLNHFVVILVILLMLIFLYYMDRLERDIERVAIEKQVNEINASLALTLYKYISKGRLNDLQQFHLENPFVFLAANKQLPMNYFGTIKTVSEISQQGGWYFDLNDKVAIYQSAYDSAQLNYQLRFNYQDNNQSGVYELGADQLDSFSMVKIKKPPAL